MPTAGRAARREPSASRHPVRMPAELGDQRGIIEETIRARAVRGRVEAVVQLGDASSGPGELSTLKRASARLRAAGCTTR